MRGTKHRGQATAELAILLPVLALIVLGCLDLGRVFSVWLTLSNATREGARYVANIPDADIDTIRDVTRADIDSQWLPADEVVVQVDPITPTARLGGEPVTVTARYSVTLLTTFIFGGRPVPIGGRTQMIVLPGGQ